jgi:hypothetical protein
MIMVRLKVYLPITVILCSLLPVYLFASGSFGNMSTTNLASKEAIALEISLPGKPDYRIPIPSTGHKIAVMPIEAGVSNGIKVAPRLDGSSIKFEVSAVLDGLEGVKSCEQLKALKVKLLGTYSGKVGDVIHVAEANRFSPTPINVKIIKMMVSEEGDCCVCGSLSCCPNPGKCFDPCGTCGLCCMGTGGN